MLECRSRIETLSSRTCQQEFSRERIPDTSNCRPIVKPRLQFPRGWFQAARRAFPSIRLGRPDPLGRGAARDPHIEFFERLNRSASDTSRRKRSVGCRCFNGVTLRGPVPVGGGWSWAPILSFAIGKFRRPGFEDLPASALANQS